MYITYLLNPESHTNAHASYPGIGATKEESLRNARYWPNQLPWVRTVPASRAPKWARLQARSTREHELHSVCAYGHDVDGKPRRATPEEETEYESIIARHIDSI